MQKFSRTTDRFPRLSFISKLIERKECVQLINHLDKNCLYVAIQSAYRQLHSMETALIRVQMMYFMLSIARGGAILLLLDLSAAFDTSDHEKMYKNTWYILWH